jgi:hypothetical protein
MDLHFILQWTGCVIGVTGAALLAMNNAASRYGFVVFLASNALWLTDGYITQTWGLVVMQVAFTITSAFGVHRWMFRDRERAHFAGYLRTPRGEHIRFEFDAPDGDLDAQRAAAMAALEENHDLNWVWMGAYSSWVSTPPAVWHPRRSCTVPATRTRA